MIFGPENSKDDVLEHLSFTDTSGGMVKSLTIETLERLSTGVPFMGEHLANTEVVAAAIEIVLKRRDKEKYIHVHVTNEPMDGVFLYHVNWRLAADVPCKVLKLKEYKEYKPKANGKKRRRS